jgi:uracil-DNA glycosylase family 4
VPPRKKKKEPQFYDPSIYISPRKVSWTGPDGADLLLIGEAPGADEDKHGRCFVGDSGAKLDETLGRLGLSRNDVKVANVANHRPADNNFAYLENSTILEQDKAELMAYIQRFPPKMIVLLGEKALEHVAGNYGIGNYRGTPLYINGSIKCIPTWHPSFVLPSRAPEEYPVFFNDLKRAVSHIDKPFPSYNYNFTINPQGLELESCVDEIMSADIVTVDIESIKDTTHILCVGFGLSKERAICILNPDIVGMGGSFTNAISRILSHTNKKVFHNGTFDVEMLHLNGISVSNYHHDTMIAQHILEPDLPKGLDFLCSTETYVPCY